MPLPLAQALFWIGTVHVALGLLFGVPFVFRGVDRIDPAARGAGVGFRLLILPGVVALWPLLFLRWRRGGPPPTERSPHRDASLAEDAS